MPGLKLGYRDAIQVNPDSIHTGIWQLSRGDGKQITLVGTMHIGEISYFTEIAHFLSRHSSENSEIHYEKVIQDATGASSRELEILRSIDFSNLGLSMKEFAKPLGWVFQSDALNYPDHAINVDATVVYLLRKLGRRRLERIVKAQEDLPTDSREEAVKLLRRALRLAPATIRAAQLLRLPLYATLIRDRNTLASEKALAALSAKDRIILVWGAAHLPDLARRFIAEGFHIQTGSFLKVGNL